MELFIIIISFYYFVFDELPVVIKFGKALQNSEKNSFFIYKLKYI